MSRRRVLVVALVGSSTLLVLLTLCVALHAGTVADLDHAWGTAAHDLTLSHSTLRSFWVADAAAQAPDVHRLCLVLMGVVLLLSGARWTAARVAAVLVLSAAVAPVAKLVLERPRPTWDVPVTVIGGFSYPSGHATAGAVLAVTATLVACAATTGGRRLAIILAAVAADLLVSLDRVFLGVHYVSDVAAGNLLGIVIVTSVWLGSDLLGHQWARRRQGPLPM